MGKLTGFEFSDDRHEIIQRRPTAHQKPLFANFGALAEEPPARRLVVLIAMFWVRLINLP